MSQKRISVKQQQVLSYSQSILRVAKIAGFNDLLLVVSTNQLYLLQKLEDNEYQQTQNITIEDQITACYIHDDYICLGTHSSVFITYQVVNQEIKFDNSIKIDTTPIHSICFQPIVKSYFIASNSLFKLNNDTQELQLVKPSKFSKIKLANQNMVLVREQINVNSVVQFYNPEDNTYIDLPTNSVHSRSIQSICSSFNSEYLITGDTQGMIVFWTIKDQTIKGIFSKLLGEGKIVTNQLDVENLVLFTGNTNGIVSVLDCQRNVIIEAFYANSPGLLGGFLQQNEYFTWDRHGIVKVWKWNMID